MTDVNWHTVPMPDRVARLERQEGTGYPIPWFVAYIDGKPDFRVMSQDRFELALRDRLCWMCGEPTGVHVSFLIGPMCAVNHVSSEPPNHRSCAEYAAQVCPFLANPGRERRPTNMPEEKFVAGTMIERNPGATLVWTTRRTFIHPFSDRKGGILFDIGDAPSDVGWYCRGRAATRDEVMESMTTGYPTLEAEAQRQGDSAVEQLRKQLIHAMALVPA